MYSQPFHSTFCKVLNLDTEGFSTPSCAVPMRDCDVGKVRIDDLHDLTVVVGELLKLEIKVVSSPDELRLRRIAVGAVNSSQKLLLTIKRLRLCSDPALQSSSLKRMKTERGLCS